MSEEHRITINGNALSFEPGQTILEVARQNHIDIPTLCWLKGAIPTGACRICVVEVKGARSLLPSCSTPAGDNMVVQTETAAVVKARKLILQLAENADGIQRACWLELAGARREHRSVRVVERPALLQRLQPLLGTFAVNDRNQRRRLLNSSGNAQGRAEGSVKQNEFVLLIRLAVGRNRHDVDTIV